MAQGNIVLVKPLASQVGSDLARASLYRRVATGTLRAAPRFQLGATVHTRGPPGGLVLGAFGVRSQVRPGGTPRGRRESAARRRP